MIKVNQETGLVEVNIGSVPSTPITWPADRHQANQIQQTKGSAKPQSDFVLPTTQPSRSSVAPRTTPAPVSAVRVVLRPNAGGKQVTVQFNHPAGDPYFASANVYLRRAGQQPTLVASGAKSPLTFVAPLNSAPHAVYVSSVGNWGETNVLTSPSHPVRLV
jgi:hypothetical protein